MARCIIISDIVLRRRFLRGAVSEAKMGRSRRIETRRYRENGGEGIKRIEDGWFQLRCLAEPNNGTDDLMDVFATYTI